MDIKRPQMGLQPKLSKVLNPEKVFVILNTFMTRDVVPMTTLWKFICMPTLLYNTSVMGKLNAAETKTLENVQRRYTKSMDFDGQHLQYFQSLKEAVINSVQRERHTIILIQIGNEIRDGNLGSIFVEEVRFNDRTGLWIESRKKVFNSIKVKSRFEKNFPFYALFLFNNLPYNIKLCVGYEKKYDEAIKVLCLYLPHLSDMSHFCDNYLIFRLKSKTHELT